MSLARFTIDGYRSLLHVTVDLGRVTLIQAAATAPASRCSRSVNDMTRSDGPR